MRVERIKWNRPGFEDLRRSPGVEGDLRRRAEAIAAACGDGYVAESGQGATRARAAVITATGKAIRDNATRNTILRNLGQGR